MNSKPEALAMRPEHLLLVQALLRKHLPGLAVWAFGSRVTGKAKTYSDLDLAILTREALPLSVGAALADELSESDLPYKVDLVDWATTSEAFRAIIQGQRVVLQEADADADPLGLASG